MDSANYVTMLLLDKGYFDYDYEKQEKKGETVGREKTDEEIRNALAAFGIGQGPEEKKPETPEEVQEYILKQMEDK